MYLRQVFVLELGSGGSRFPLRRFLRDLLWAPCFSPFGKGASGRALGWDHCHGDMSVGGSPIGGASGEPQRGWCLSSPQASPSAGNGPISFVRDGFVFVVVDSTVVLRW